MIIPAKGFAFIKEDTQDPLREGSKLKEEGFEITESRNVGVYGDIIAVNNSTVGILRDWWDILFGKELRTKFKVGQKVIFSKFAAEYIYLEDENGKEIKNIRSIPVEMILGTIHA